MKQYETLQDLIDEKSSENVWATVIAPYLAQKIFDTTQSVYADVRLVPSTQSEYISTLPTLIVRTKKDNEYKRMYLWVATKEQALSANVTLDPTDHKGGFHFLVCTTVPAGIEFYNKYDIIQECDPLVYGTYAKEPEGSINRIVAMSTPGKKKVTDELYEELIQQGVENFVLETMELVEDDKMNVIALYTTSRHLRRGLETLFEDKDILIGDSDEIKKLGEQEQIESETDSTNSDDSDSSSLNEIKIDDVIDIHNELITLADDFHGNMDRIRELLEQMVQIGPVDYLDNDEDSNSSGEEEEEEENSDEENVTESEEDE